MEVYQRDNRFLRQLDFADPIKFKYPVTILGLGSIGSAAAVAISKMGLLQDLSLIDFDSFEEHNLSNQFGLVRDVGVSKVTAISSLCEMMGNIGKIKSYQNKLVGSKLMDGEFFDITQFDAQDVFKGIVLSLPDSMKVRKEVWDVCRYNVDTPFLIDARAAAEYLVVYVVNTLSSSSIKQYEETLHSDEEASPVLCGARAIIYTTFIAGGLIASLVKKIQLEQSFSSSYHIDISKMEITQVLNNGKTVSNRDQLALATVE